MRILVTGASGFLGWNLTRFLQQQSGVTVLGSVGCNTGLDGIKHRPVDLENRESIVDLILWAEPDVVVHTAAMKDLGPCEENSKKAKSINIEATNHLLENLPKKTTHFIYCSTDMIFDGLNAPYNEDAPPSPRHVYGETKYEGEIKVLSSSQPSTIIRLALLYGRGPKAHTSFIGWMHAGLESEKGVTMYANEFRTALYVNDAVEGIWEVIKKRATGIFHLAGSDRLSRMEFAIEYAKIFNLPPGNVHGAPIPPQWVGIYRPPDLSMTITHAREVFGFAPQSTVDALRMLKNLSNGF